jgi:preprotein translocase subunit SecA
MEEDEPIEHGLISKSIESAQTKVEGHNFDLRKHVVEYDDVMNRQREVIYADRRRILSQENLRPMIEEWVAEEVAGLVAAYLPGEDTSAWDYEGLHAELRKLFPLPDDVTVEELEEHRGEELLEFLQDTAATIYDNREQQFTPGLMRILEQQWMIHVIDRLWIQHLTGIDDVREGIGLRAYGQRDPLVEYKVEAASMFDDLLETIRHDVVYAIYHVVPRLEPVRRPQAMTTNLDEESGKQPVKAGKKPGRNEPCYCGSGRKFKKCHGR